MQHWSNFIWLSHHVISDSVFLNGQQIHSEQKTKKVEQKQKHISNSTWFLYHLDPILRKDFSCRSESTEKPILAVTVIKYARSWVWTKYLIGSTPPPSFGDDAPSTNLFHQQRKRVANNILHRVCCCWILDVLEVLGLYHFWWDPVQELLHLLLYVFEEGCAQPSSDMHDQEDGSACQIHRHGCSWSDWFWSNFGSNDPKFCFSNCNYAVADQVHDHFWCDADDFIFVLCKRNWWVCIRSFVKKYLCDDWRPDFYWAQANVICFPLGHCVRLSVVLLSFESDCDAVGRIQFGRAVIEYFFVFDECNIAEAELLCLLLLCFWYF